MINKIILEEINDILKLLFKNDFFSDNNISDMDIYLNTNFKSYDEMVMESYKNYIRNKLLNDEIFDININEQ